MKTGFIYGLVCPKTKRIVYVGQSKVSQKSKVCSHWNSRNAEKKRPICIWLRRLRKKPSLVILEENVPYEMLNEKEMKWIQVFSGQLLNVKGTNPLSYNSFNPLLPNTINRKGIFPKLKFAANA